MLLGHARGKVGDLVFARVNGQQITRARATEVKNPQTEKQMIQRIILNTVIQAYSRMAEICDHSFEGVAVGQKSMSKFMKENMSALRSMVAQYVAESGTFSGCYAFSPKGVNMFTPNEWILSTGQLPEITLASVSPTAGAKIVITSADVIPTYGEIISSLGLNRGDQLTFIGQELYTDGRAAFKFARVILDPRETDGSQATLDTPFLADGIVNKPSPRNEGADIAFSSEANGLIFDLGENSMFGSAVIVSREKADGSWLRSNARIQLAESIPYTLVGAMDMEEALYYAMSGGIDLESDRYLNNAVRGSKIVASPQPTPPVPTVPELTSLVAGSTNVLPDTGLYRSENNPSLVFAGNNLSGSYLVLADVNKSVGDPLPVSGVDAGQKYAFAANSGTIASSEFAVPGLDTMRIYLVKDDAVIQVCGRIQIVEG